MTHNYIKSMLFCLVAVLSSQVASAQGWDGSASSWTQGNGDETNPYVIENEQQMAYLAEQVNAGTTYEGKFFKLAADLDMGRSAGKKFPVIGKFDKYFDSDKMENVDASFYFKGTFDGNRHTIDNLFIEYLDKVLGGTGLFACTTDGTVIRNLNIGKNSEVDGDMTTGAFVGQMTGGIIENCHNMATVKGGLLDGNMFTGGIVGVMENGTVRGCVNSGAVSGTTEVGGIAGQMAYNAVVENCYNTAAVTASGFGGAGMAGAMYDQAIVRNCYNTGAISGQSSPWMGEPHAITADAAFGCKVENCYYIAELSLVGDDKATAKTAEEMKAAEFLTTLNAGASPAPFVADEKGINDGLPILNWQAEATGGIDGINGDNNTGMEINGNKVTADKEMTVYDMSGRTVARGNSLTLGKGMYIIKAGKTTGKVIVR